MESQAFKIEFFKKTEKIEFGIPKKQYICSSCLHPSSIKNHKGI